MILLLAFTQDEETPADRLLPRQPSLWILDPTVVDIHAAGLHEPPSLAPGRRQLGSCHQVDDAETLASKSFVLELGRRHIVEYRQDVLDAQRVDRLAEQDGGRPFGARRQARAMHERGHFPGQHALRLAFLRRGLCCGLETLDGATVQEREVLEVWGGVAVVCI